LISGCSGGGKTALVSALRQRGEAVVEEPGRRVVKAELESGGRALPWLDMAAFARKAIELANADLESMQTDVDRVFFDRGLIDAAVALERAEAIPLVTSLASAPHFYNSVFFAPPWRKHFSQDRERQSSWEDALEETHALKRAFAELRFSLVELPMVSVAKRADFVLKSLR
jgi:predicted ATPase